MNKIAEVIGYGVVCGGAIAFWLQLVLWAMPKVNASVARLWGKL